MKRREGSFRRGVLWGLSILFIVTLIAACGCYRPPPEYPLEKEEETEYEVPEQYRETYDELDAKLGEIEAYVAGKAYPDESDTIFSAELIVANANRGEALIYPGSFFSIGITLDALKTLGITAVNLSIGYPILDPSFPRSDEYLEFYKNTVAEIRARGLKLIVDSTTLFPSMGFSDEDLGYSGLTLDGYKQGKRLMVEAIIRELQPDYFTIENEPMTMRDNTGLDFSVADQTEIVNYILSGLDRSGARIGAGAGTWDDIAYFESLARSTDLDYLDMHIYPIQQDFVVDRMERIAEIAGSTGKGVAVGEAWLYKASLSQLGPDHAVAAAAEVFALDPYSFWIPLDERFVEVMVTLSHGLDFEYFNPFWTQYFFAYIDYNPTAEEQGMDWVSELASSRAWINIQAQDLTPTGERYRELIGGE
jgi:hypothetical protein